MKTYSYENATVHIEGDINIDKVKEATLIFLRECIKEGWNNVHKHKTRTIEEQQVLDK